MAMVNNTAIPKENTTASDSCPNLEHNTTTPTHTDKDGPFNWDEERQGTILGKKYQLMGFQFHISGMFFYGYVLTQIPGGRLAELFGGKWLFGIGKKHYCTS